MAVIGAGYWGPNLVRNISGSGVTPLRWLCDLDLERATAVAARAPGTRVTADYDEVLDDPEVAAVAIATPAGTHASLALMAIAAGKHVLVEKPLAATLADGEKMVHAAEDAGVVLMCDHTYCYTPAVRRIRELVSSGHLGEVHWTDAVRINLGLVQNDIDVFWDLAPHDLSILDFVLPADRRPTAVAATGSDPIGAGQSCVGYLSMPLQGGGLAHAHVNWLSPTKVRTTIIGGSLRTVVWDDLHPYARLSIHDKGVEVAPGDISSIRSRHVSYRVGDIVSPALAEGEALQGVIHEFAESIAQRRAPLTDGAAGLRVLRVLDGVNRSLAAQGLRVDLEGNPL